MSRRRIQRPDKTVCLRCRNAVHREHPFGPEGSCACLHPVPVDGNAKITAEERFRALTRQSIQLIVQQQAAELRLQKEIMQ